VQAAKARAEEIIKQSQVDVDQVRRESDEYVIETLTKLELELDRYLNQVRNGIHTLQKEHHPEQ
jgi:cell division septum initiation protein DivIVA